MQYRAEMCRHDVQPHESIEKYVDEVRLFHNVIRGHCPPIDEAVVVGKAGAGSL